MAGYDDVTEFLAWKVLPLWSILRNALQAHIISQEGDHNIDDQSPPPDQGMLWEGSGTELLCMFLDSTSHGKN